MGEKGQRPRESDVRPVEEDGNVAPGEVAEGGGEPTNDERVEETSAEVVEVGGEPADGAEAGDAPLETPAAEHETEHEAVEPPGDEPSREELLVLAAELEDVRRERDEYLDTMRRMKAEMENSRRRLERDRARLAQLASEKLVRELLPVLDNLERALEVEGDIRGGVRATRDGLLAALGREGLEPVRSNGESFDPSVHEAVMGQPSEEHEEDTVIQTLERGYTMNGRTIRAAKVIVAKQV